MEEAEGLNQVDPTRDYDDRTMAELKESDVRHRARLMALNEELAKLRKQKPEKCAEDEDMGGVEEPKKDDAAVKAKAEAAKQPQAGNERAQKLAEKEEEHRKMAIELAGKYPFDKIKNKGALNLDEYKVTWLSRRVRNSFREARGTQVTKECCEAEEILDPE